MNALFDIALRGTLLALALLPLAPGQSEREPAARGPLERWRERRATRPVECRFEHDGRERGYVLYRPASVRQAAAALGSGEPGDATRAGGTREGGDGSGGANSDSDAADSDSGTTDSGPGSANSGSAPTPPGGASTAGGSAPTATESPAPSLLLCFHGGGGSARRLVRRGDFRALADREGFLLVYPDAIDGHWNDGRASESFREQDATIDDVAYTRALLADLRARERFDPERVYAAGISNGGMFCQRLALECSETFAAVATIIASLPEPLAEDFAPASPISMLFLNGTEDPLVPDAGGEVVVEFFPRLLEPRERKSRGRVLGTARSVELWRASNELGGEPRAALLPDRDPADGTRVFVRHWSGGRAGTELLWAEVRGGGHTVPGSVGQRAGHFIGRVCRDLDGYELVWCFLARQRRVPAGEAPVAESGSESDSESQ